MAQAHYCRVEVNELIALRKEEAGQRINFEEGKIRAINTNAKYFEPAIKTSSSLEYFKECEGGHNQAVAEDEGEQQQQQPVARAAKKRSRGGIKHRKSKQIEEYSDDYTAESVVTVPGTQDGDREDFTASIISDTKEVEVEAAAEAAGATIFTTA